MVGNWRVGRVRPGSPGIRKFACADWMRAGALEREGSRPRTALMPDAAASTLSPVVGLGRAPKSCSSGEAAWGKASVGRLGAAGGAPSAFTKSGWKKRARRAIFSVEGDTRAAVVT